MTGGLVTTAQRDFRQADFPWDVAPPPRMHDTKVSLFNGTWFVARRSRNPDAAWEPVKYLTTREAAEDMARATGFPVPRTDQVESWFAQLAQVTQMPVDALRTAILGVAASGVENINHLFVDYPRIVAAITQALPRWGRMQQRPGRPLPRQSRRWTPSSRPPTTSSPRGAERAGRSSPPRPPQRAPGPGTRGAGAPAPASPGRRRAAVNQPYVSEAGAPGPVAPGPGAPRKRGVVDVRTR